MKTDINELVYNEDEMDFARSLMQEIQNDLYDADCLLYDAVMKISYAPGINQVEFDNHNIDLRMPESYMIQCREETKVLADTLNEKITMIDQYNHINMSGVKPTKTTKQQDVVNQPDDKNLSGVIAAGAIGLTSGFAAVVADAMKNKKNEEETEDTKKTE